MEMHTEYHPGPLVTLFLSTELLLATGPGYVHLPFHAALSVWLIILACLSLVALARWRETRNSHLRSKSGKGVRLGLLTLACLSVVAASQDTPLLDLGSSFLGVILFIKLLELNSRKESMRLLLVSLLPALAECYHDQSPLTGLRLLVVVLLVIGLLIALTLTSSAPQRLAEKAPSSWRGSLAWKSLSRLAGRTGVLVLQALPVSLVLFMLLPRPQDGNEMPTSLRQALYGMDGPQFGDSGSSGLGMGRSRGMGSGAYFQESGDWFSNFLSDLQDWFDRGWESFLNYGTLRQQELWLSLGLAESMPWWWALLLVLLMIVLLLVLVAGWMIYRHRCSEDPLVRLYRRYCKHLAQRGTVRLPHEGPEDFSRRAAQRHPLLAMQIEHIGDMYGALRYGCNAPANAYRQLQHLVDDVRKKI
ncbi:MAG: DUF3488 domain-containing protein [Magnetococcales bacterium]|nr:DUF3488 domain-containing protein [Magnetococcales bacterium]